ncbi:MULTISPECIES: hypothetical protein [Rhodococcus]|uniref:hypothetical protein n=1 Tax=Rhodococcus TaxID=1827 RepID=UPI00143EEC46|nr:MULTISPECIES: hypothetical protein [Rhodococcus]QIX48952.1 hypothetical protein HFP48_04860 [Rhodococcus sp. DMU1]QRI75997.1 hypothetical protein JQ505_26570 [Rhodococcus aetherivorans]QSE59408.1 hypothetical protein JYA75_27670 [Rhodococcus sp. PSBB066]QSE69267.1 hypothetical protein JYA91_27785 [Rhodococcus sp. PSBB049]
MALIDGRYRIAAEDLAVALNGNPDDVWLLHKDGHTSTSSASEVLQVDGWPRPLVRVNGALQHVNTFPGGLDQAAAVLNRIIGRWLPIYGEAP